MTPATFKELLEGFRSGNLSAEQRAALADLLHSPERRAELEALFGEDTAGPDRIGEAADPEILQLVYQRIRLEMDQSAPPRRIPWRRWYIGAAAVVGLLLITGVWWWANKKQDGARPILVNVYKNDVEPGGNHAVLTLGNGARILLDSIGNGSLASQGGTKVVKVGPGSLAYQAGSGGAGTVCYNTVSTPVGGQYQITLPDGTKVWLNALSSLRYPTAFDGPDRSVELVGEGYFEVAKSSGKPFHLRLNGLEVEVLGTTFDVNAYSDESSIKTSLLEGAVRLLRGGNALLLRPGEQGQTTAADGLALVKGADMDAAVAWKNGFFSFQDADIRTVMRQLSRWYGIEVKYEITPTEGSFGGEMGRDLKLTQVLDGLTKSGVHFKLEGKVLTVLP